MASATIADAEEKKAELPAAQLPLGSNAAEEVLPSASELMKWFAGAIGPAAVKQFRKAFDSCQPRFGVLDAPLLGAALRRRGIATSDEEAFAMIGAAQKWSPARGAAGGGGAEPQPALAPSSSSSGGISFAQFFVVMARRYWRLQPWACEADATAACWWLGWHPRLAPELHARYPPSVIKVSRMMFDDMDADRGGSVSLQELRVSLQRFKQASALP